MSYGKYIQNELETDVIHAHLHRLDRFLSGIEFTSKEYYNAFYYGKNKTSSACFLVFPSTIREQYPMVGLHRLTIEEVPSTTNR